MGISFFSWPTIMGIFIALVMTNIALERSTIYSWVVINYFDWDHGFNSKLQQITTG